MDPCHPYGAQRTDRQTDSGPLVNGWSLYARRRVSSRVSTRLTIHCVLLLQISEPCLSLYVDEVTLRRISGECFSCAIQTEVDTVSPVYVMPGTNLVALLCMCSCVCFPVTFSFSLFTFFPYFSVLFVFCLLLLGFWKTRPKNVRVVSGCDR